MRGTNKAYSRRKNRRQALRNKVILSLVAFSIAMIVGVFGTTSFVDAHSNSYEEPVVSKYYKSIELQEGDTLWGIAETYMDESYESIDDYIKELKKINNLDSDDIHEGRYLMVAYNSNQNVR